MTQPLSKEDVARHLETLNGWEVKNDVLWRKLEFKDFSAAFAFMTRAAMISEQQGHHPNWSNVYNQIEIGLTTHDAGNQITEKDIKWAKAAEQLLI